VTKEFDRATQPNESFLPFFPGKHQYGHDTNHEIHLLHSTLLKHGYKYSHSSHVAQPDNSIHLNHTWVHRAAGHLISADHHDTKLSSKVSVNSPQTWTGIGRIALDKHLKSRARRTKQLPESSSLPSKNLQEGLHSGYDKVKQYVEWMSKNPMNAMGVIVDRMTCHRKKLTC
jgi:hypothetical protein